MFYDYHLSRKSYLLASFIAILVMFAPPHKVMASECIDLSGTYECGATSRTVSQSINTQGASVFSGIYGIPVEFIADGQSYAAASGGQYVSHSAICSAEELVVNVVMRSGLPDSVLKVKKNENNDLIISQVIPSTPAMKKLLQEESQIAERLLSLSEEAAIALFESGELNTLIQRRDAIQEEVTLLQSEAKTEEFSVSFEREFPHCILKTP